MKIGIGLPNAVPDTPGARLLDWAVRAEERGFSALATIDRIAYPSHDSITALAGVAGATRHIGLMTNILLAPLYPAVLLAKSTATLDQLCGGRLTLGMAPGGRPDDFTVTGQNFKTRGRDLDATVELMRQAWHGEAVDGVDRTVCPIPVNDDRVPILFGGTSEAAIRRTAAWGDGWTMGGGTPDMAESMIKEVRTAWADAGREGEPRLAALAYYSLGDDAERASRAYLHDYYGFLGEYAGQIADSALRSEAAVADAVRAFEAAGVTELYLDPTTSALEQVDRLADVVL